MIATQRQYKDVETGEIFRLFTSQDQSKFHLLKDETNATFNFPKGTGVNGFYICAFTSCTIKINGKKEVFLPMGSFYNLKEGEEITHKKFIGFKRFSKV